MPACARREIVRQGEPGIYHAWSRCVRRAFLLGTDPLTGKDYHHRREWVIERLKLLVASFAVDVGFVAVLSNHLHVVLRTDPRLVKRMGSQEVARRWLRVFPGRRVLDGAWIEPTQQQIETLAHDKAKIEILRKRLSNAGLAPIMDRLKLNSQEVPATVAEFPNRFPRLAGTADQLMTRAAEVGRRWLHGAGHASRVFR